MSNSKDNQGVIAQDVTAIDSNYVTIFDSSSVTLTTGTTISYPSYTIDSTGNLGIGTSGMSWNWVDTTPFENCWPEWNDFQRMCQEYPGLEKTFRHLVDFYKLSKDDWESKKKGDV